MRLALATLLAAVAFAPAAQADHVCIYSEGREIYCTPHLDKQPEPVCVSRGGHTIICVP